MTYDFSTLTPTTYETLEGRIAFRWFDKEVDLSLDARSIADISERQKNALWQFLEWDDALFRAMEQPIFAYYRDFMDATGETEPEIAAPADVWEYIQPRAVLIPNHDRIPGNGLYVQIECDCDWEREHGLEMDVKNNREILYIGSFEGNGYINDGRRTEGGANQGNFAQM